jgi:hypothetical protein
MDSPERLRVSSFRLSGCPLRRTGTWPSMLVRHVQVTAHRPNRISARGNVLNLRRSLPWQAWTSRSDHQTRGLAQHRRALAISSCGVLSFHAYGEPNGKRTHHQHHGYGSTAGAEFRAAVWRYDAGNEATAPALF